MDSRLKEIPKLFNIRGTLLFDEPMDTHTTFRIGGKADVFFTPANKEELIFVLAYLRQNSLPFFILGGGANILVSDKGIRGMVFDLSALNLIQADGETVTSQAGLSVNDLCSFCAEQGLAGLENFYGMPGSVGGSVWMNARCYERSFCDHLLAVECLSKTGEILLQKINPQDFDYKKSPFQKDGSVILSASFLLQKGITEELKEKMKSFREDRVDKGHFNFPCAGSLFKNNRAFGKPTGQIIDSLGLKGYSVGDAVIATYHANIFINKNKASASDMRALIMTVQEKVKKELGYELEPEVLYVGEW